MSCTLVRIIPIILSNYPSLTATHSRANSSQSEASEPNTNYNGLGSSLASLQLESVDSRADTTVPDHELYSTIPESYRQEELGSSAETEKHPPVNNTYED